MTTWINLHTAAVSVTPRRGRDLWAKLRQTVKQSSLADVLSALGAIPSGFRDSTLAKLIKNSSKRIPSSLKQYTILSFSPHSPHPPPPPLTLTLKAAYHTSTWVFPKPSPTGIAFKDLKWNHARDQVISHNFMFSLIGIS